MKRLALATLATVTLFAALPAAAQFQKAEDAIKYRKGEVKAAQKFLASARQSAV